MTYGSSGTFFMREDCFVSADSGYRGAQKVIRVKGCQEDWFDLQSFSKAKLKNSKKSTLEKNKQPIKNRILSKPSIRAKARTSL